MRYRAVFFDLDGTLTDSGEGIIESAQYAFRELGLPLPDREDFRKMVGPPLSVGFSLLGVPAERIEDAIFFYRDQYNNRGGKYKNRVYPGIEALLRNLRKAGFLLYVATSKPEPLAREILEGFGLAPYFAYIAGATMDHSRENKGDVLNYLLSVVNPADGTVMVGDTRFDVTGAHDKGVPCIGVTWGYGLKEELETAGADAIVDSPGQLLAVLSSAKQNSEEEEPV